MTLIDPLSWVFSQTNKAVINLTVLAGGYFEVGLREKRTVPVVLSTSKTAFAFTFFLTSDKLGAALIELEKRTHPTPIPRNRNTPFPIWLKLSNFKIGINLSRTFQRSMVV